MGTCIYLWWTHTWQCWGNRRPCSPGSLIKRKIVLGNRVIPGSPQSLTVIAGATGRALASYDILTALALATKWMTLEACGAPVVTAAGQCAVVIVRGQREDGILTKIAGIVCNVKMILAAVLDELLGLIKCLLHQQIVTILTDGHHHQIVQPNTLGSRILFG